jgi:hypothetical protein
MNNFKINDTVKYEGPTGSWGIIEDIQGERYHTVKWYYGKDIKGEYMTSISRGVSRYNLEHVNAEEFWRRANRKGFSGELGDSTPGRIFVKNESIAWFKGKPDVSGDYLVQKEGFDVFTAYWDNTTKDFSSHDGGDLLPHMNDGTIYHANLPTGIRK